jgi:hypothetical protein
VGDDYADRQHQSAHNEGGGTQPRSLFLIQLTQTTHQRSWLLASKDAVLYRADVDRQRLTGFGGRRGVERTGSPWLL